MTKKPGQAVTTSQELEITPEMVRAGADAARAVLEGVEAGFEDGHVREIALAVLRAAKKLAQRRSLPG